MKIFFYGNSFGKVVSARKLMPTPLRSIRIPQSVELAGVSKNITPLRTLMIAGVIAAIVVTSAVLWNKQPLMAASSNLSSQNSELKEGSSDTSNPSGLWAKKMMHLVTDRFDTPALNTLTPLQLQEQSTLANWYGRRYRISRTLIRAIIQEAYTSAAQNHLDPHLVIAVIAIESGFNPYAESKVGAKGLMQVLPSAHPEKLRAYSSDDDLLSPLENVKVGAQVLRQYLKEQGSVELALKKYVGSINQESDNGYANKVLEESARIKTLLDKNTGVIALNL